MNSPYAAVAAAVGVSQAVCSVTLLFQELNSLKVTDEFGFLKALQPIFRSKICRSLPWGLSARQQYHLMFSVIAV